MQGPFAAFNEILRCPLRGLSTLAASFAKSGSVETISDLTSCAVPAWFCWLLHSCVIAEKSLLGVLLVVVMLSQAASLLVAPTGLCTTLPHRMWESQRRYDRRDSCQVFHYAANGFYSRLECDVAGNRDRCDVLRGMSNPNQIDHDKNTQIIQLNLDGTARNFIRLSQK